VANERTERLVHLIVEGKPDEARARLARPVPLHKDPGLLHYRVGRAWLDARRPDLAVGELEESLAAAPGQGEVHLVLGQALLALQRPADAIPHLQAARERNVFPDTTGLDLARALFATGRRDEARAAVASTPLLEDSDAPTALALGNLALQLDDPATGQRFLEAASRLDPSEPTAPYNLALLYARAGRMADARRAAERALALDPASADARSLLEDLQRR
jgi:tetratricopeptide (TPR) repeat protein